MTPQINGLVNEQLLQPFMYINTGKHVCRMFVSAEVKQTFGIIIKWIIELPLLEITLLEDYRADILGVGSLSEQMQRAFKGKFDPWQFISY